MKHFKQIAFLVFFTILIFSCQEDKYEPEVFGTLVGQVLLEADNSAIASATISTNPPTSTVLTDATGLFSFENIKTGTYTIRAEKSGLVTAVESVTIFENQTANVVIKMTEADATNTLPSAPKNPMPANGSTNNGIDMTLSWEATDPDEGDVLRYDVYLYNANQNPNTTVATDLADPVLDIASLQYGTTYFWQVGVKDGNGDTVFGEVWSFTTKPFPPHPFVFVKTVSGQSNIFAAQNANPINPLFQLTQNNGANWRPRFNPAGSRIAFITSQNLDLELWVMGRDGTGAYKLPASPSINGPSKRSLDFCWSPDGTQLLYMSNNKLLKIAADGNSSPTLLAELPQNEFFVEVDWTAQGNKIAARTEGFLSYQSRILLYDDNGNYLQELVPDWPGHTGGPCFSVDGNAILFNYDKSGFESSSDPDRMLDSDILLLEIATGDTLNLSVGKDTLTNDFDARFAPTGAAIIFTNSNNFQYQPSIYWVSITGAGRDVLFSEAEMPDWR
ncbi:MAG: carboxypeptidase regulatory-like domain-containing protein [Lewinellaceae bacterium]|nr:carboxypeptidase regulatory-like domain-containing protein [Saprospiraceae bacterium]MCB9340178.1 carboxypeptidase regulatory-like domain-containing protein [Lewinellaceae bacterium]